MELEVKQPKLNQRNSLEMWAKYTPILKIMSEILHV